MAQTRQQFFALCYSFVPDCYFYLIKQVNYMYYSLADLNNFDKLDFVIQIKRKTGKQTAIV